MKVLITTSTFGKFESSVLDPLKEKGLEIVQNPFGRKMTAKETIDYYGPDIAGVIAGTEPITKDVINRAKSLKVISRCGIGVDNIDMVAVKAKGIQVYKTLDPVVDAVAELTLAHIFSLLRKIPLVDRNIRCGIWNKPMGNLLKGKTIGFVGLGNIAKKVVELTGSFYLKYLAYDINHDNNFADKFSIQYVDLNSLLKNSDIISIHLPINENTKNLINRDNLELIKPCALLINTSRGGIVDEKALYDYLSENKIGGAALDVFENEPYKGHLKDLDNVILSSHIGSYAKEARVAMEFMAVDNLLKGFNFGK
ncbi:MAG: phosphoglycerate dehydrogenase [Candidatus Omnitrophota bacterium]